MSVRAPSVTGGALECDEVYQVALGRSHAFGEEVDEGVEELRPLSVRLVHIGEACEGNVLPSRPTQEIVPENALVCLTPTLNATRSGSYPEG